VLARVRFREVIGLAAGTGRAAQLRRDCVEIHEHALGNFQARKSTLRTTSWSTYVENRGVSVSYGELPLSFLPLDYAWPALLVGAS